MGGADEGLGLGQGLLDRLPRLRLGAASALRGLSDGRPGDRSWRAAVDDVRRVQVELLIELGRLAERTPV